MSECIKCRGRIIADDIEFKKRLRERQWRPYDGPPKVCCECLLLTILEWDGEDVSEEDVRTRHDRISEGGGR